jgi:hypothetical protein
MMERRWWGLTVVIAAAIASACSGPAPGVDGGPVDAATPDGGNFCASDDECLDTRFCNGDEHCRPDDPDADRRGCVHVDLPCMESQRCIEEDSRCVTQCAVMPDADGDGVDAIECMGADCDDADPSTYPGNPEVCDEVAHDEDCDPSTYGHRDEDRDQMDDVVCCNVTVLGDRICGADCSDQRPDIRLGFAEVCDGFDNDCDGMIDERVSRAGAIDADFDLHGAAPVDPPIPTVTFCAGEPGFSAVTDDCADDTPAVHGAQVEICDMIDNDCDLERDENQGVAAWYPDDDGDGFGAADAARVQVSCTPIPGFVLRAGDCADDVVARSPAQIETCNAIDDDCDGRANYLIRQGDSEDDDGDGYADRRCGGSDCNDADPTTHPDAVELADERDNDCDGMIDDSPGSARWYVDADLDGYGDAADPGIDSATFVAGRITRAGDCDDDAGAIHPGAADFCDSVDDDCDGRLDEGATPIAFFSDVDRDGWGGTDVSSVVIACAPPVSASARIGDCLDGDPAAYPGAPELCDLVDQDCDTRIDEDADATWYVDLDGDGVGAGAGIESCTAIAARVRAGGDCDDTNPSRHPGRAERCDGGDDDCDAVVDEMAASSCTGPYVTSATCVSGACVLACASGHGDCDGTVATGCEIDTAHAAGHCGMCFEACALADSCGGTASGTCDDATVTELAAGAHTFFARRATGGVAVWGGTRFEGAFALATLGTTDPQPTPVLAQIDRVAEIAQGETGGCARGTTGEVMCWGALYAPSGGSTDYPAPTRIPLPRPAVSVGRATSHACAVLDDGSVQCWGYQLFGRLGNGAPDRALSPPRPVTELGAPIVDAVAVSCGYEHTCVMRETAGGARYVSCFGNNPHGELALGVLGGTHEDAQYDAIGLPTDLVAFSRGDRDATCVRNVAGRAWCWGNNYASRVLGLGSGAPDNQPTPITPPGLDSGVLEIGLTPYEGAADFTGGGGCAIRGAAGGARELLCWGAQTSSTPASFLGDGVVHGRTIFVPTLVGPAGSEVRDALTFARSRDTTCVSRASGGVWCAGLDSDGQLGDGPVDGPANTLVRVIGL